MKQARKEKTLYEERHRQRKILSEGADEATRAVFDNIDSFDAEPTSQKAEVLVQITKVAPECFGKGVQEALFRLAAICRSGLAHGVYGSKVKSSGNSDGRLHSIATPVEKSCFQEALRGKRCGVKRGLPPHEETY
jgi:hypothetical protein